MSHPATESTSEELPVLHLFVVRDGKPCIVSVLRDGVTELGCERFDDEHRALARLAMVSGWR